MADLKEAPLETKQRVQQDLIRLSIKINEIMRGFSYRTTYSGIDADLNALLEDTMTTVVRYKSEWWLDQRKRNT